ncbi:hypothetical protein [Butyricicoccus sp.]|uniref:hypothetical protein n=1 Tax=Butyricicoccus sp. TaxID=2049021 RepID=UPI003F14F9BD
MTEINLTVRRNWEVTPIPDIREQSDRRKDKHEKRPAASAVQRQMVQKFVKEVNDSAKQPDSAANAESAAAEQVEAAVCEIAHEAVQLPRTPSLRNISPDRSQTEQSTPRQAPDLPRQRTVDAKFRSKSERLQNVPVSAPQEQRRRAYTQQAARATVTEPIPEQLQEHPAALDVPRQCSEDLYTQSEPVQPQNTPKLTPQGQARCAYIQQTAKTQAEPISHSAPQDTQPANMPLQPRERPHTEKVRSHSDPVLSDASSAPQEQGRRTYRRKVKKTRTEEQSVRDDSYATQSEIHLADDLAQRNPLQVRKELGMPEGRSQAPGKQKNSLSPSAAAPAETKLVQHIKQPGSWTPRIVAAPDVHSHEHPIREQITTDPANAPPPTPQAQMRRAFVKSQARRVQSPSINPSEQAVSILRQPIAPEIPAATANHRTPVFVPAEEQPRLQPAPQQAPPTNQPPAIRERTNRNAAPREKPRSGVTIRTRETVPPGARKLQPAPSVSGTAAKRAQKVATQDAQRKMLKKSNSSAARATAAASKRLVEAAAKAAKELISILMSLGGGTALLIVFSLLIVASAFLASPLGILFADEQKSDDTVPLATAIAEIQGEYHAKLEELQSGDFASIQIVGQAPDWREVVAVFASKTAGSEDGMDVFTLDAARVELLRQVFWDMCQISTQTEPTQNEAGETEIVLTITITAKTAEQMRLEYAFSKYQNNALDVLLENLGSLHIPMGSLTISQEDAIILLENLPDDLDPARKAVVETALQLVGKVSYFWGGKSLVLGWDDRWGVPTEVTAEGSGSTGTVRPFGLDCSGFVDWVFYNATNGAYYPGHGGGAATQHSFCENIPWSEA